MFRRIILRGTYIHYWIFFPIFVLLILTLLLVLLFRMHAPFVPQLTVYSYFRQTRVHRLLAGVHTKQSRYPSWGDGEFSNAICQIWTLSFRNTLPLKRNTQHEPHQKRHVTDSTCGVWAGDRELKKVFTFSIPWHVHNVHVAQADMRHLKQKSW